MHSRSLHWRPFNGTHFIIVPREKMFKACLFLSMPTRKFFVFSNRDLIHFSRIFCHWLHFFVVVVIFGDGGLKSDLLTKSMYFFKYLFFSFLICQRFFFSSFRMKKLDTNINHHRFSLYSLLYWLCFLLFFVNFFICFTFFSEI